MIGWTAASVAPPGWLIADGSTFDTARYAALSAALGGASTLPDMRDRFPMGAGATYALLATGGGTALSLSIANLPAHAHSIGGNTGSTTPGNTGAEASHTHSGSTGTESANHSHGPSNGGQFVVSGSGASASISVGGASYAVASTTAVENASHTHSYTTGAGSSHSHSSAAHTHTLPANTGSQGSGTSVGVLNPYIALTPLVHV